MGKGNCKEQEHEQGMGNRPSPACRCNTKSYRNNRATDTGGSEKRGPQSHLGLLTILRNKLGREELCN